MTRSARQPHVSAPIVHFRPSYNGASRLLSAHMSCSHQNRRDSQSLNKESDQQYMRAPSNPLVMIGPTILLIFALSFLFTWWRERKQQYLLFFCASCLLFCLGTSSQILAIPPRHGSNAVVSAFLYTLSVLVLSDGLFRRSGQRLHELGYAAALLLLVAGIAYFYYVDRQLLVRIYILNFGLGLILLSAAWSLRRLRRGRTSERYLFWILLAFSVHFFPRTILTVGTSAPAAQDFGFSYFWIALQFSLAVLGVALALALLAVIIDDTIEVLRRERATDPLTGLLNRRGFMRVLFSTFTPQRRGLSACLSLISITSRASTTLLAMKQATMCSRFGQLLSEAARKVGICARLGGEEFVVLMPNYDAAGAYALAEQLRHKVRNNGFDGLPDTWQVTVSLGVAEARPRQPPN